MMLGSLSTDYSFNQRLMSGSQLSVASAVQSSSPVNFQPHIATSAIDSIPPDSSQNINDDAVAAGNASSQSKSATAKSETANESEDSSEKENETNELTVGEKRVVSQLKTTDLRVRAHEKAHLNAAQGIAVSGADYQYQVGPDDRRYAVAGEVTIDTSKEDEPRATIDKGYNIIRAALAPTDPSQQDLAVANYAEQMIMEAQAELMRESYEQNQSSEESESSGQQIDQLI